MVKSISLPKNFRPSFLYEETELDVSDWTPLTIENQFLMRMETYDGVIFPKRYQTIFNLLLKRPLVWCYTPPGKIDSIVSLMKESDIWVLYKYGKVETTDGYIVRKTGECFSIGRNGISTKIYNLLLFCRTMELDDTLEGVAGLASRFIESRQLVGLPIFNPTSGAAEARSLIASVDEIRREVVYSKSLRLNLIDLFNAACYGGRMESCGLGTQNQLHLDMIKAHLNILKDYPGLAGMSVRKGLVFSDEAADNSIYKVVLDIPRKWRFNPIPTRDNENRVIYKTGKVVGWYYKDYIRLLEVLGLDFKILDSVQLFGEPTYPFRETMTYLGVCNKILEDQYKELEFKHLYCTVAGSTKSIFRNFTKTLDEIQIASRVFDPLVFGFVLARQNVAVYEEALEADASSIKIDSYSTTNKSLEPPDGFQDKGSGNSLYVTPFLKSLPDGQRNHYREAIEDYPDRDYIVVSHKAWNGLASYCDPNLSRFNKAGLGKEFRIHTSIRPHYGNRLGTPIKKVGHLLDCWFLSSPSDTVAVDEGSQLWQLRLNKKIVGGNGDG